ncbi:MAG: protein kinase [Myxococcota bacterium]
MGPGVVLDERFEVQRHAASGGMGQVFRAFDRKLGLHVAIKTFEGNRAFFSERFAKESAILAELRHPRIVSFVARGLTPDGRPYLAMEWIEGTSLQDVVRTRRLTLEETVIVGRHVAEALGAVHRRGIIHRDLKPGNLIVIDREEWSLKVLDFGLAALVSDEVSATLQGTPAYMSPELAQRQSIDASTDVFSLGCVLYECLTQTPAFFGPEPSATLSKVVMSQPEPLGRLRPSCPGALVELVDSMLAKDAARRPKADEILELLGTLTFSPFDEPSVAKGVTLDEQRITSLIVVQDPAGAEAASRLHRTQLSSMGFSLRVLVDGTIIGILESPTPPLPSALRGLRAAVELSNLLPNAQVTVGMGQVRRGHELPVASAMDAAFARLKDTPGGAVSADESIALLAVDRYEITSRGDIWIIEGERAPAEEPRPVLGRVTPLLGRDSELQTLQASFRESASEGRPRYHLLLGDEGSGKSRVLWAAAAEPQRRGAKVLRLRGEVGRTESQGLWLRGIREYLGLTPRSARAQWEQALKEQALPIEAAPMLSGEGRPNAEELYALLAAWFIRSEPAAVVIDDIHHADAASLETLRFLLRRLEGHAFWVLAAGGRGFELGFEEAASGEGPELIQLPPLSSEASHRLVEIILGEACEPGTRKTIVERAQGNPFVLEELVRAVARGEGDILPQSVLVLAQSRLQSAPADARRVLRAGSIFGRRFWKSGVAELTGMVPKALAQNLDLLLAGEFIRRVRPDDERSDVEFAIRHAVIREAAYASLPREERVAGHARAAEWMGSTGMASARDIARHWEAGGFPEKAAPHLHTAAQAALEAHDFDSALETALRAQRFARPHDVGELCLVQADVRALRGEFDAAASAADLAVAALSAGSEAWYRALSLRTSASGQLGVAQPAADALHRLDTLAERSPADEAICLAEVLIASLRTGELDQAQAVEARFPSLEAESLPARGTAHLARAKAACAQYNGLIAHALAHHEEAAAHFRKADEHRWTCVEMAEAGQDRLRLGDIRGARRTLDAARQEARAMGLPHVEAVLTCRVGHAAAREGQLEGSEDEIARATRAFLALKDTRNEGIARFYMAFLQRFRRRLEQARQEAERARQLLDGFPSLLPTARAVLARVLLDFDERDEALEEASLAHEALEAGRLVEEGDMFIYLALARALEATEQWPRLDEILWSARTLLLRRADLIGPPSLRTSFLVRVPENAKILALARRLDA